MKFLDIFRRKKQDDTYLYIEMSDLKWYPSYKDVSIVNSTIEAIPDNEAALIAVGEDSAISASINNSCELDLYTYTTVSGMVVDENSDKTLGKDELVNELRKSNPEYFI